MRYNKLFDPEELREIRKEAGFTQQDLADRLGISRETVVAIENAKKKERHLSALETIELQLLRKWWDVCRLSLTTSSQKRFSQKIAAFFNLKL